MKWGKPIGADIPMGKNQPEYDTVWLRQQPTYITKNGLLVPMPSYVALIEPEPHEIEHINEGKPLYVHVLGDSWPPLSVRTTDPMIDYAEGRG